MARKIITSIIVIMFFLSIFTNGFILLVSFTDIVIQTADANPGNVTTHRDTNSSFTVEVANATPTINFVGFIETSGGTSKRDTWVDINNEYAFVVNVTSSSGWEAIEWINITAWYDQGSESSTYNSTSGGNLNMKLQYDNSTETKAYNMLWPDDEVTKGTLIETFINATTCNITFPFTPLYQVRHSSGDGDGWDTTANTYNDAKSWNFNVTVDMGNTSTRAYYIGEYGIYQYVGIGTTGSPTCSGSPGAKATASAVNVQHRANGNFTLITNIIGSLDGPGSHTLANTTVGVAGGNLSEANFDGTNPLYIWGTSGTYQAHPVDNPTNTTSLTYHCDIPYGTYPGTYTKIITYDIDIQD
ncbi:hypothetical protein MBGDN05_00287 [Thermoplasmatales archaeon SCGC AB-539-N05]|nr:hypothetical protein MBGDN05_00287 [Thermoplasmatales archaeon SCGC AB-539-N05]